MLARLRARLTFANACSFLALLIALGTGSAYAANTVFSTDIVDGEVKTADLDSNAVRSTKIGTGQVPNQDLGADAVDGSKVLTIATPSRQRLVNSANVANESLTSAISPPIRSRDRGRQRRDRLRRDRRRLAARLRPRRGLGRRQRDPGRGGRPADSPATATAPRWRTTR